MRAWWKRCAEIETMVVVEGRGKYKIECAKKVSNPKEKERHLHEIISKYGDRIDPKKEFFYIPIEDVKLFLRGFDGEEWVKDNEGKEEESITEKIKTSNIKGCRDMIKCFTNGQHIRHAIGIYKTWNGTYDLDNNVIVCDGEFYKTLSGFATAHRGGQNANGWKECECEVNGKWISTFNL